MSRYDFGYPSPKYMESMDMSIVMLESSAVVGEPLRLSTISFGNLHFSHAACTTDAIARELARRKDALDIQ